jgi:hypothetical protein
MATKVAALSILGIGANIGVNSAALPQIKVATPFPFPTGIPAGIPTTLPGSLFTALPTAFATLPQLAVGPDAFTAIFSTAGVHTFGM